MLAFALLLLIVWPGTRTFAAPQPQDEDETVNDLNTGLELGLATDRKTLGTLQSFRNRLQSGQNQRALEDFRRLQTSDPFFMVPAKSDSPTFVPLYRVLFDEFHQLPEELRKAQIGRTNRLAQQLFAELLAADASSQLPLIIQRYPGTDASLQCHLVMAKLHLGRGQRVAARAWLQPLTNLNIDADYRRNTSDIIDQLQLTEGSAEASEERSTAAASEQLPSHLQWQFQPILSPRLKRQIDTFQEAASRSQVIPQTTWSHVMDGQTVFRRTLRGVAAVDTVTGQTRWLYPVIPDLESLLPSNSNASTGFRGRNSGGDLSTRFLQLDKGAFADAFCRDSVSGSVTADGERVYLVVADSEPGDTRRRSLNRGFMRSRSTVHDGQARLVALERRTGRRVWSTGAASFAEQIGTTSDTCWIAGPPSTSRGRVFCVIEWNGEMRLACVSARTGEPVWSTVLAYPDQSIQVDAVRRLWSVTPLVEGGLIWCSTTTGWTACVDEVTQTVLWATYGRNEAEGPPRSIGRGRPVAVTPPASLADRWSRARLVRSGNTLMSLPNDPHVVDFLNAVTGERIRRIDAPPSAVLVHADDKRFVLASPQNETSYDDESGAEDVAPSPGDLRCLRSSDGDEEWIRKLTVSDGLPTGPGVRRDGMLLVPMSTGKIAAFDLQTGRLSASTPPVLPQLGWGYLASAASSGTDLLYVAPETLLRISTEVPVNRSQDPIALASGLMASGNWVAAAQQLEQLDADDPSLAEARPLRFECQKQLAIRNPERYFPSLAELAETPEQTLQVQMIEVAWLTRQGRHADAAARLIQLLKLPPAQLSIASPSIASASIAGPSIAGPSIAGPSIAGPPRSASDDSPSSSPIRPAVVLRSVMTEACHELTRLLDVLPDPEALLQDVQELPTAALLRIRHPSIRPVLHQRLQDASFNETTLHVLHQSIELARQPDGSYADLDVEARILVELLTQVHSDALDSPSASQQAGLLLLQALVLEYPDALLSLLAESSTNESSVVDRKQLNAAFRDRVESHYRQWTAQPYQAIPVLNTPVIVQNQLALLPAESEDAFLREYKWSAISGDYGRLQAERLASVSETMWSIPGVLNVSGTYSNRTDLLRRVGSVVVLQTYGGLTAFSVADQRILWSRKVAGESVLSTAVGNDGNFERFVAERDTIPSNRMWSLCDVVGAGHRWLCIRQNHQLEVLDLLSGSPVWSVELPPRFRRVVATRDVVLATDPDSLDCLCFARHSGAAVEIPDAADLTRRSIRNVADRLVCWQDASDAGPAALQWIEPLSGRIERHVPLTGMTRFHFSDDGTLVGFNDRQQMQIVRLVSGETRTYSFAADSDEAPASPVGPDGEDQSGDSSPAWKADQLQMAADGLHYYICSRVGSSEVLFRQPSGRRLMPFRGALRAIDRQSGSVVWTFVEDRELLATTDQADLPVMILIESRPLPANAAARQNIFTGIMRLTGERLFQQTISSQYGLRYTSITSARPNSIDIGVYGTRIRLQGTGKPTKKRSINN
ncbi:MAG: PQQ-binding-like beta-propeller repeat protein [Fuerstiella sp.]